MMSICCTCGYSIASSDVYLQKTYIYRRHPGRDVYPYTTTRCSYLYKTSKCRGICISVRDSEMLRPAGIQRHTGISGQRCRSKQDIQREMYIYTRHLDTDLRALSADQAPVRQRRVLARFHLQLGATLDDALWVTKRSGHRRLLLLQRLLIYVYILCCMYTFQ